MHYQLSMLQNRLLWSVASNQYDKASALSLTQVEKVQLNLKLTKLSDFNYCLLLTVYIKLEPISKTSVYISYKYITATYTSAYKNSKHKTHVYWGDSMPKTHLVFGSCPWSTFSFKKLFDQKLCKYAMKFEVTQNREAL